MRSSSVEGRELGEKRGGKRHLVRGEKERKKGERKK